jgi:hypothetical protein
MNRVVDCENMCQRPQGYVCTTKCCIAEEIQDYANTKNLQEAVFAVLEGWTLPHDVRKILENAYYRS